LKLLSPLQTGLLFSRIYGISYLQISCNSVAHIQTHPNEFKIGETVMIPLATMHAARPSGNPLMASIYAGILTAVIAYAAVYFLQNDQLILFGAALLLTGIGPVLGYAFASGRIGASIPGLLGGILGSIIPVVSVLLWPILVGALTKTQSIGKLLLGSIIGAILGAAVFFGMASVMGQDPSWFGAGVILTFAVWGGACAAIMTAWAKA
jgi:hypothetical protein